jgi:hypothetical protein
MMEPPRYVAGPEPNLNSIAQLYRVFRKFGQIITIETIVSGNVAFIEFADLLSALKAVVTRRSWYLPGLPRGRGTQMNVISSTVNSVTRKPKRNETEGEVEGKTKSNR